MDKLAVTKGIFAQLLTGEVPNNEIRLLSAAVDENDVEWLMRLKGVSTLLGGNGDILVF